MIELAKKTKKTGETEEILRGEGLSIREFREFYSLRLFVKLLPSEIFLLARQHRPSRGGEYPEIREIMKTTAFLKIKAKVQHPESRKRDRAAS